MWYMLYVIPYMNTPIKKSTSNHAIYHSSLSLTMTTNLCCAAFADYILRSVLYKKKDWWGSVSQSFFGYDNDEDLKALTFPIPIPAIVMVANVGTISIHEKGNLYSTWRYSGIIQSQELLLECVWWVSLTSKKWLLWRCAQRPQRCSEVMTLEHLLGLVCNSF